MADKSIRLRLETTAKGLRILDDAGNKLTKISVASKTTTKGLSLLTGGLGKAVVQLTAFAGAYMGLRAIKDVAGSFLAAAKTTEALEIRFNALLGSVEEGSRLFKELTKFASKVPYEYEQIMESAAKLAGIMDRQQIMKWLPLIADLAAATGLSIDKATEQVQRMLSAGAASADLFRERGVLAMLGFQAKVSYSAEQTRRMLWESWTKADSQFRGVTGNLAKTWAGTMSMMRDAWFSFRTQVMQAGVFDFLKTSIQGLLTQIKALAADGSLQHWAKQIADAMVQAFKMAAEAARLFGITIQKVATLHDQFWSMVPESMGGGKDKMTLYEEKLKEYDAVVKQLQYKISAKQGGMFPLIPGQEAILDKEIAALQRKMKAIKAGLDFLDGKLNITLPAFPDTSGIGAGAGVGSGGGIGTGAGGGPSILKGREQWGYTGKELFENKLPEWQSMLVEFADTYGIATQASIDFNKQQGLIGATMGGLEDMVGPMTGTFSNFFSTLISGTADLKSAFARMGESIVDSLIDIISKMMAIYLLKQMISIGTSLFGGGAAGVQKDLGPGFNIGNIAKGMTFGHEGGLVTAMGIRKYHTGGPVLRQDEVPAILQVGERIIPKGGAKAGAAPSVEIHIHNEGEPMKPAGQTTRYEQGKMVVDLFLERMSEHPNDRRRVNRSLGT